MTQTTLQLVRPAAEHLPGYVDALNRGWSPDTINGPATARRELDAIEKDPQRFLDLLEDREAAGDPIVLSDGTTAPRLPGYRRWLWDGAFAGSISFRWVPGTTDLPPHVLGHVGYTVVPWKRRRGYATEALRLLLPEAQQEGLDFLDITTAPDNRASQRVIEANGGTQIDTLQATAHGGHTVLRYRIPLTCD